MTFGKETYILPTCDSALTTELPQRNLSEEERDSTGRQEDDIWDQENTLKGISLAALIFTMQSQHLHVLGTITNLPPPFLKHR